MTFPLAASAPVWAGRSLREGFFMFWETLWPLVLGFALSGAVQAFVPRRRMERVLGDHGPGAVARASAFGMASSSCSYAASAMAKSLFAKGADFVTSIVFMVASTNLVVELGIVLVVLMGWQFAAAEFVGGPIMIALLALVGGWAFSRQRTAAARQRLDAPPGQDEEALGAAVRTKAGWADAATYTVADLTMLRRELLIGYVVAGFLTVLVPAHVWSAVFLHGHGVWTSIENVIVGPLVAVLSFVCSIGNVPVAAALWRGGISFGGVVAFIFADLITFPLLLVYRKYYGTALMLRMLAVLWGAMAVAGLVVGGVFSAAGLVPHHTTAAVAPTSFHWDYTTVLNIIFLAVFGALYWAYRHRDRWGGGQGYALDPVCGMQVRTGDAPAHTVHGGRDVWFCSDHCKDRFGEAPERFPVTPPPAARPAPATGGGR
ncbi:MAG TPA: permease [Acidimicrobiales bacterium]|nr:permease [Acidimicrobiales bacterium]